MSSNLTGKVVAITGGARGIGYATARACRAAGATVVLGDIDLYLAKQAAAELGTRALALPLDVTSTTSFSTFLADATIAFGAVDVLVNNAGVMLTGEFFAESSAIESKMIDINLRGVLNGCKIAGTQFARRGHGHLINIASIAGIVGMPGVVTYCATKFGVVGLSQALREELAGTGVKVSAVCPGIVHTELSAGIKLPTVVESFASVEPEDIAIAVVKVIDSNPAFRYVPRRLAGLLRATGAVPEGSRRFLNRLLGAEGGYLNVDQATRDAYHSRAVKVAD